MHSVRVILRTLAVAGATLSLTHSGAALAQSVLHVDVDAPGPTHDGLSWETAYDDLQDALAHADGADGIPGTEDDDLRLLPGSPCIDAGNNGRVPPDTADLDGDGDTAEPTPLDLDSSPRIVADPDTPSADPSMAAAVDMGAYEYQPLFPMVPYLDITPGTCPNRLSLRKQPLLQIAVVGSRSFNVSGVEVESLTLERADGVGGTAKPLAGEPGLEPTFKDVATPFEGELCDCHDRGRDGTNDLVVWFSTRQTAEALELQTSPTTLSVTLTLHGALLDGTPFKASDCVLLSAARPPPDVYPRRRKGRPR